MSYDEHPPLWGHHKKVLIIDDDEDTRILLTEDLRELGFEAIWAADGVQAIPVARRERPDLIVLDYRLPGGDGATVLKRLRQLAETAHVPVIVLSRQRSRQVADEVLGLGATAYVQKSFASGELRERVLEALASTSAVEAPLRLSPPQP